MSLFDINYNSLLKQLLPGTLRKARVFRWLRVLISPVVYLYNLFKSYRSGNLYDLGHTSQVTSMQAVLNDTFDNSLRRIRIVDDIIYDPVYLYLDAENNPVYLYTDAENQPVYFYTENEVTSGNYDFVVEVPIGMVYDLARMNALINKYRLPSKSSYLIKAV